jgi:hypothetical protein
VKAGTSKPSTVNPGDEKPEAVCAGKLRFGEATLGARTSCAAQVVDGLDVTVHVALAPDFVAQELCPPEPDAIVHEAPAPDGAVAISCHATPPAWPWTTTAGDDVDARVSPGAETTCTLAFGSQVATAAAVFAFALGSQRGSQGLAAACAARGRSRSR